MKNQFILWATIVFCFFVAGCKEDNGVIVIRPTIQSVSPSVVETGDQDVLIRIIGTDFVSVQHVDFGVGINVLRIGVPDESHIDVSVDVSDSAATGPRTLTILTAQGSAQLSDAIEVEEGNEKPKASFSVNPKSGNEFTDFAFDATESSDPDGTIESYKWDFGDGHDRKGDVVQHTFDGGHDYSVSLTVKDDKGLEDTVTKEVHVWSFADAVNEIDDVCKQFLTLFGKIETLSAQQIVVGFSKSESCGGRQREIDIIENQKPNVGETNVDIIGNTDVTALTENTAKASLTARFFGTHKDGTPFDGITTHFFDMVREEDGWKICEFTAKNN